VKVLDFGLVKAVHLGPTDKASANAVVGTPHFMPPEAVEAPEKVDARSDIYSIGAVGYWLLTGRTLFESEEVDELLERLVKQTPPRPSEWLNGKISTELEQLIMRCLAKNREQRPATAEELDESLAKCVGQPAWTDEAAQSWWETNLAGIDVAPAPTMAEKTLVIAPRA
jgi:serine/threonine protein kinase